MRGDRGGIAQTVQSRSREDKISASRRRQEEQIVIPKTLKSGRYDEKATIAQKIAETDEKRADLREKPDARYAQRIQDFRQIQDPDPLSRLFGESKNTQKVRVREWQRQFEKENEDTWLPYERTNFLTRSMPNWFVKRIVAMRDRGGLSNSFAPVYAFTFIALLLTYYKLMYVTETKKADPATIR